MICRKRGWRFCTHRFMIWLMREDGRNAVQVSQMIVFCDVIRMISWKEMRDVGAQRKIDAQFVLMSRLLIILRDALSYLPCSYPDDRICISVVVVWPRKHINAEGALLETFGLSRQGLFHDKPKEGWIALAVPKVFAADDPLELMKELRTAESSLFE